MLKRAAAALTLLTVVACTPSGWAWNHPNVVLVEGPGGIGSGVVIMDDWILTAKHLLPIDTADDMPCGEAIPHPTLDLALVPCEGARAYGLSPAMDEPKTYQRVYTYSWHQGDTLMKTEGFQAQQLGWMSAPVIFGSSGGAVVNARGDLMGIIVQVAFEYVTDGWGMYAVPHIARYTVLNAAVRGWIGDNING